ncbi:MAG: hypothetical protein AAB437_03070 [Patescibacteria group bacterium]
MSFPKIVIEKDEKQYSLLIIGLVIVPLFIFANIVLRNSINFNKKKLIISQKQLLLLKKQQLKPEFTKKIKLESKCPDEQAGNPQAELTIKYFYSPVCFWCILEDQHLDELLQKEGQAFKLEKYNRENCDDVMQKYKLSLAPGFVFSTKKDSKEYTVDGYISKENLAKVICDVAGYCLKNEDLKPANEDNLKGKKVKIRFE